jgi:excisionase family DNA binding protein
VPTIALSDPTQKRLAPGIAHESDRGRNHAAVARQTGAGVSRALRTVANMTALHDLPVDPVAGSPRLGVPLLRPVDAAELLSVRPSWIYEAVRTNRLPCLRVGRHIRFTREMLEGWLAEHASA